MKKIKIYSTPTCPYCKQEKAYLTEKGVVFKDFDVTEDEEQAHEMVHKSGQMGVPVTIIRDDEKEDVVVGFDKKRLDEILGL